jgi:lipid-A-disaccharide synthase-like uncharacterized protein
MQGRDDHDYRRRDRRHLGDRQLLVPTSVDNGTTWSLTPIMGQAVTFTTPGRWLVQFQAVDEAGNATAWAPATAGVANTACHT